MRSADTDVDDEGSLYDQVVDATGIEYNTATDAEEYKNQLVRYFGNMSEDDFDALSDEVREWVNEATLIFNRNRRTKEEREPLPDIEGMPTPPPPRARRARISISDEEEEISAPPPARRPRIVAAPPEEPEEEPEEEAEPDEEPEEEAAPPRRATSRTTVKVATAKPAAKVTRARDPDSGRYAKVMPHYLKHRDIAIPELQARIEKVGGDVYSEMTLDRTLAACRAVVAWAERNGVDFAPAMRQ